MSKFEEWKKKVKEKLENIASEYRGYGTYIGIEEFEQLCLDSYKQGQADKAIEEPKYYFEMPPIITHKFVYWIWDNNIAKFKISKAKVWMAGIDSFDPFYKNKRFVAYEMILCEDIMISNRLVKKGDIRIFCPYDIGKDQFYYKAEAIKELERRKGEDVKN